MKKAVSLLLLLVSIASFSQNVGIGINTPNKLLHLKGIGEVLRIQGATPWIGFMNNAEDDYKGFIYYPDTALVVGSAFGSNQPLVLAPNNIGLLFANAQQRVGIGTSDPQTKLHITSDNAGDGIIINAPSPSLRLFENTSEKGFFKAGATTLDLGTTSQLDLNFHVGFNSRMRLNRFGEIGINSVPVAGTILKLEANSSNDVLRISGNDEPGISFYANDVNRAGIRLKRFGAFGSQYAMNISLPDPEGAISFVSGSNIGLSITPGTGSIIVGNSTNDGTLNVNGFSWLGTGANAVGIKVKRFSGTLPVAGATVQVFHGLDPDKILSVDMFVSTNPANFKVPPGSGFPGFEYNYLIVGGNIEITPKSGNSIDVALRPVNILVIYRE